MAGKNGRPPSGANKRCTGCGQVFPNTVDHFPLNGTRDGVQRLKAKCRDCYRVYKRKDEQARASKVVQQPTPTVAPPMPPKRVKRAVAAHESQIPYPTFKWTANAALMAVLAIARKAERLGKKENAA